jgi:outer membrane lipoprotein LolB
MTWLSLRTAGLLTWAVLGLGACSSATRHPDVDVDAVTAFELSGRVAVKVDERGYTAGLKWRHREASDDLWLYSPVGSVVATVNSGADGARLTEANGKVHESADVQSLTREFLGWDLPLSGLSHWVRARPAPAIQVQRQERDQRSRLTLLTQNEWDIRYSEYQDTATLPAGMNLQYRNLRIKLIINEWRLPAT